MNVLIYNGPGTSQKSVSGAVSSLTALLSPYYSVRLASPATLITEPWSSTTALLVIPGGRDVPYCNDLNGDGTRKIDEYVRRGGKYLGLCAGAYWASKKVEFELDTPIAVQGSRELGFWRGICRGCAFAGFVYDSEDGAKMARLRLADGIVKPSSINLSDALQALNLGEQTISKVQTREIYWNGGGTFVNAEREPGVEVLASYDEAVKVEGGSAAVIFLSHGSGKVMLSAVHPEIGPPKSGIVNTASPVPVLGTSKQSGLDPSAESFVPSSEAKAIRARQNEERLDFLRILLHHLGLQTNAELASVPQLSTLHVLCYTEKLRAQLAETLKHAASSSSGKYNIIKSDHDTFQIIPDASQRLESSEDDDETDLITLDEQVKYISTHRHPPGFQLFDAKKYFASLHKLHYASQPLATKYTEPSFGTCLLYAETVTSSQSLLDKNFSLQRQLPDGLTILCSHQLTGRGRGQNSWISPAGVLSFSTLLHHTPQPSEKPNAIVFIQYLVSLAVTESILDLRPHLGIKIKWPNDIYLELPIKASTTSVNFTSNGKKYAKVSGSLITTNYHQGKYILTLGIGINVSNPHPTISLNSVLPPQDSISLEVLFATIMVNFHTIYQSFIASNSSFSQFEERYYRHWFHSDQVVTIESSGEKGMIKGIDPEHGTLSVKTDRGAIGLQADGNSFDMMKGLLKLKR